MGAAVEATGAAVAEEEQGVEEGEEGVEVAIGAAVEDGPPYARDTVTL